MGKSTISDIARAVLALDQEEDQLRKEQLVFANAQYQIWLRLEAISAAKANLCHVAGTLVRSSDDN